MSDKTIEQKLTELKKTIDFKWRVQSTFPKAAPTHAIMIPYVDARDVQERLDKVIGASGWQNDFKSVGDRLMGGIGILINNEWVWKWDRGMPSQTEKEKGEASDAFKRAAVQWGINRDAYSVGTIKLSVKEYNGKYYPCDGKGQFLKGAKLYEVCNTLAKITDLENYDIDISSEYLSEMGKLKHYEELTPTHKRWKDAIKSLKDGNATIDEICNNFEISEENRLKLMSDAI